VTIQLLAVLAVVAVLGWLLWWLIDGLNWLSQIALDRLFDAAPNEGQWTVDVPGRARRVR